MLHFKTCKLPGGCDPASLVWAASSSSTLCREREGPSPTSTSGKRHFFPIPASNNFTKQKRKMLIIDNNQLHKM